MNEGIIDVDIMNAYDFVVNLRNNVLRNGQEVMLSTTNTLEKPSDKSSGHNYPAKLRKNYLG